MKQLTLATAGFERYAKTTRRAVFLAEMEQVVPWPALCRVIDPVYPKAGNGRLPIGVERMLRIYFLQQWFNERVRRLGRRMRKTIIVALARKVLIALWRYTTAGVVIEGAVMKPAPATI